MVTVWVPLLLFTTVAVAFLPSLPAAPVSPFAPVAPVSPFSPFAPAVALISMVLPLRLIAMLSPALMFTVFDARTFEA